MTRLVAFLIGVLGLAALFSWLADNPGTIVVDWMGYHAEPSVFQVVVMLAALAIAAIIFWSLLRSIWTSPATLSHFMTKRRQQRGLDALSSGMIAIGAGDHLAATRYAQHARKSLPNEPMTHLLRAQAAQLSGDRATARRIYEAMLSSPDTEQLGLRGLYVEAHREGETEAQRQFAERAIGLNPKLPWPVEGLFDLQCKDGDWAGALNTLNLARKNATVEQPVYDRRRAVLLAAQAMKLEDQNPEKALGLAMEAHALARDLIPAAAIAGRLLASKGNVARAAKIIQKTWARAPHPDLATAYAYARIGDSPRDRLDRVRQLQSLNPNAVESSIAVATAAIEARAWHEARAALDRLGDDRMTRSAALLMARLEKEEHGDTGRAREWLARAANAPRDAAWTADGTVTGAWAPVSPVTGRLDAVEWRVPVDETEARALNGNQLDEFVALGAYETASGDIVIREPAVVTGPVSQRNAASTVTKPATAVTINDAGPVKQNYQPATVVISRPSAAAKDNRSTALVRPDVTDLDIVTDTTAASGANQSATVRVKPVIASSASNSNGQSSTAAKNNVAAVQAPKRSSSAVPSHAPDDPGPPDDDEISAGPSRLPWPYRVS